MAGTNSSSLSPECEVVITGAGLVSSLGLDRETTWQAVRQGRCGIAPLTAIESPLNPNKGGGEAPALPTSALVTDSREPSYLHLAISEALRHADITEPLPYPAQRCGLLFGTTLHGMRNAGRFLRTGKLRWLGDFLARSVLRDAARDFGLEGMAATVCAACSSGLSSVALAVTLLKTGHLDLVVAGGYDPISEYAYGGFNSMRLIAEGDATPFSRDRDGLKLGEGYGVVVLERTADVLRRRPNGECLAIVAGSGESCDAHHLSKPDPEGRGAASAMASALGAAGIGPDAVDLIAAHATATPDNDAAEFLAMRTVFGSALESRPVVAFKSHLGHTLGGAGAVELILSAMALRDGIVPPCANSDHLDSEFEGLTVSTEARSEAHLDHTLNTSLGFGGANCCTVLRRPTPGKAEAAAPTQSTTPTSTFSDAGERCVLITGVGVVTPRSVSNGDFAALFDSPADVALDRDTGAVPDEHLAELVNARRVRRMSTYAKLTLAATTLAYRDATIEDATAFGETCSAVLGTAQGATDYSERYYTQIVEEGIEAANPMLFAEGVPNAAGAHVGTMLAIKGLCQTVIGSRTAGLDALILAAHRIASGEWDRAIVSAAEEYSPLVNRAYEHFGLYRADSDGDRRRRRHGFVTGAGAVTFILESRQSATKRGSPRPDGYGHILATGTASVARPASRAGVDAMTGVLNRIGAPSCVLSSANGTWIDFVESRALRKAARVPVTGSIEKPMIVSAVCGHLAECFSVTPLAGLAAVLLSGRVPRFKGPRPIGSYAATGDEQPASFGVIATDYAGGMSGVRVSKTAEGI